MLRNWTWLAAIPMFISITMGCTKSEPAAAPPDEAGNTGQVEMRYAPRYYGSRCYPVFGRYDGGDAEKIEGDLGRRVDRYDPFQGGLIVTFKDGGRIVAWDREIDCKDPPFDPMAKAMPTPATATAPVADLAPANDQGDAGTEPTNQSQMSPAKEQATWSPSFDCRRARTQVEHMICANQDLSAADRRMVELYKEAMAATTDKRAFKREQDNWRSLQRDTCRDVACVREAYAKRTEGMEVLPALTPHHLFVVRAGTAGATQ